MRVTGEVALMLDALGCRQGDGRILDVITLVGPGLEIETFEVDGERSTYFTFRSAGTDLIFEDDILVSVTVWTREDGRAGNQGVYPRPAALVDGLPLAALRTEVTALLGVPERVGAHFDRFAEDRGYLHVEFDGDGRVTRISTLLEPV